MATLTFRIRDDLLKSEVLDHPLRRCLSFEDLTQLSLAVAVQWSDGSKPVLIKGEHVTEVKPK